MKNKKKYTIENILQYRSSNISKNDIEFCLAECLQKNRSFIISHNDYILNQDESRKILSLLNKLGSGLPLAYVLGYKPFYKHNFLVNKNVLIPRDETELIIDKILDIGDDIFKKRKYLNVIDLGAGSGCIGLTVAIERPKWRIILIEKSLSAIEILQKNKEIHGAKNAHIIISDWLHALDQNSVNMIVANPPYVEHQSKNIQKSVKFYEPSSALFAGDKGLMDIKLIIEQSKTILCKNGVLLMENGFNQSRSVKKYLEKNDYKDINVLLDYNKIERFTVSRT